MNKFKFVLPALFLSTVLGLNFSAVNAYDDSSSTITIPAGSGGIVAVNGGAVNVSTSANSPTGNVALGATNVEIARFNLSAADGEDIAIKQLVVSVPGAVNNISMLHLYDGDRQVASVVVGNDTANFYTDSLVVAKGSTETIKIFADILPYAIAGNTSAAIQGAVAVGTTSGISLVLNDAPVSGNIINITPALPDMVVSSIILSQHGNTVFSRSKPVQYAITIKNQGGAASGTYSVWMRNRTTYFDIGHTDGLPSLGAGEQYTLTGEFPNISFAASGVNDFKAVADSRGVVTESNETNNGLPILYTAN